MLVTYLLKPEFRMYHIDLKWIKTRDSLEPNEIIKLLKQDKAVFNKVFSRNSSFQDCGVKKNYSKKIFRFLGLFRDIPSFRHI